LIAAPSATFPTHVTTPEPPVSLHEKPAAITAFKENTALSSGDEIVICGSMLSATV
jgi:hypothetical protein